MVARIHARTKAKKLKKAYPQEAKNQEESRTQIKELTEHEMAFHSIGCDLSDEQEAIMKDFKPGYDIDPSWKLDLELVPQFGPCWVVVRCHTWFEARRLCSMLVGLPEQDISGRVKPCYL